LDAGFLRYWLQGPEFNRQAFATKGATDMADYINLRDQRRMRITLPPKATQRRIAAVLSAFDELIELNERRIELLEGLVRLLYREWFVHFRFPRHDHAEFADSELGPIPEGWTVGQIADIAPGLTRGISPKYAQDGNWTVINQRCIRNQRVTLSTSRRHEGSVSDAKRVRFGDILINSTGVGTLGRIAMFLDDDAAMTADSHVTIARPRSPDLNPWFGLHMLNREGEFQTMGTGSTGQTELSRTAVGALPLAIPPRPLLRRFADFSWPLLKPLPTLAQILEKFAVTRDLLLPRLITGRLDISDVDPGVLTSGETE
jgi:type I restriction enzyme S subunit